MAFINMAGNRGITETIELVKEAVSSLGSSVVGSGGGDGLLNFSWGSEEDFVDRFADEMEAAGFEKIPAEMM